MNLSIRIYAALLTFVGLWCIAIVAAPVLHTHGGVAGTSVADALYLGFSRICHQIDGRSFHLFGAKFGVCIRCASIYFSFLAGLLIYPFIRSLESNRLPNRRWLLLAVVPMIVDALFNDLRLHPSSDATRVVSGSVAGFIFAFYILPLFIEAVTQLFIQRSVQGESPYVGQTQ